jgi:hypothetical protein
VVQQGTIPAAIGEVFIASPDFRGWATLELRDAHGRVTRWAGIL